MPTLLRPAHVGRLLADFIAAPVGMRSANHLSLIGALHSGNIAPRAGLVPGTATLNEWIFEGSDGPWSAPLWMLDPVTGIALLEICGPLVKGYDDFTAWFYECASIDRISRALDEIASAPGVRALVICIDSPGGVCIGMPELSAKIAALATRLLVVTHTSDCAASNGMRLAVAGSLFFPTASAQVGCIGVYIALYDYCAMLEQMGVKLELYRAGKYKGLDVMGHARTPEESTFLQDNVDRCNADFQTFVRSRRPGVADSSMQGQWFDGAQAVELGLADDVVTGLPEVLAKVAASLA